MPVESATYISDLNASNPIGATDPLSSADDHLRLLKSTIKATFPSITGPVTPTHTAINQTCVGTGGTFPAINGSALTSLSAANLVGSHALPDGVLSTNVPLVNASNTFVQAVINEQEIKTTAAVQSRLRLTTNNAGRGYLGAPGAAGDLVSGSAVGDIGLVVIGGNILFSLDNGGTAHHKFTPNNATTTFNGVAVSDFARLSQSNTFTAGPQLVSANGSAARFNVNDANSSGFPGVNMARGGNSKWGVFLDSAGGLAAVDSLILYNGGSGIVALEVTAANNFNFKSSTVTTNGASAAEVGTHGLPQNSQSANYTTVLVDRDRNLHQTGASKTFTIDSNANVAYPIGTTLVFSTDNATGVSIAITADTLRLAGTAATGTRTLAQYGIATAIKVAATTWLISGPGLS